MAKLKKKSPEFHFGFSQIIRLLIFFSLIYFGVNFFASSTSPQILGQTLINLDPTILPSEATASPVNLNNLTQKLPPSTQNLVNDLPQKTQEASTKAQAWIQQQLKDLKKEIAKQVYQEVIKSIDK